MTQETIVVIYDTAAEAAAAVRDLVAADVPAETITQHADSGAAGEAMAPPHREKGFWARLFGGESDEDTSVYDRSVEGGSTVVSVRADEQDAPRIIAILERHNPVDIDQRSAGYAQSGIGGTAAAATTARSAVESGESLPLAEEQLNIGKRVINRGTTRIRRFAIETPVEQQVTLRDETVRVERGPVADSRPVSDADFSEKTIEMSESGEEPMVSKTARVKEEVSLRKDVRERTETVRDKVRRDDVEIKKATDDSRRGTDETVTPASPVPPAPESPRAPKV